MDQNLDLEMKDIKEEMGGDLGRAQKKYTNRRRRSLTGFRPQRWVLVLGGVGVLILIVVFALFFGGENRDSTKDFISTQARIDLFDKRLAQIEETENKIALIEGQFKRIQKSMSKFDRSRISLRKQLGKLSQTIDRLQKRMASFSAKTEAPSAGQKKAISQDKRHYHEVRRGDSLYRIAKKYGISLNELHRINNITQNQHIYPGQKIFLPTSSQP
jgi:LysM repeat protein